MHEQISGGGQSGSVRDPGAGTVSTRASMSADRGTGPQGSRRPIEGLGGGARALDHLDPIGPVGEKFANSHPRATYWSVGS